jgi:hypothetical protein
LLVILAVIVLLGAGWLMFGRPSMPDASGTAVDPGATTAQRPVR